jgi:hypothetical protein
MFRTSLASAERCLRVETVAVMSAGRASGG